jgi:hypothetical protein
MTRAGRGGGGGGGGSGSAAFNSQVILRPADGATVNESIQEAVDAAADYSEIIIDGVGTYFVDKTIRLRDKVRLRGLGDGTILAAAPTMYGGAIIACGEDRPIPAHGDAILDDADFSYEFGVELPSFYLNLGFWGFWPQDMDEFWMAMPFMILPGSNGGATFFNCSGQIGEATGITGAFGMNWNADLQHINVRVRIGVVEHTLTTTTAFHTDVDTRRWIAVGFKNDTLYLFVDGVLEDTAATSGLFTCKFYEFFSIGCSTAAEFPTQEMFDRASPFLCGGFFFDDTCKHTTNYVVSWTQPTTPGSNGLALMCLDSNEEDGMIRFTLGGNGYSWMQADRHLQQGLATTNIEVTDLRFGGSVNDHNISVYVYASLFTKLQRLFMETAQGTVSWGNSYYSETDTLRHSGEGRWGIQWRGGLCHIRGVNSSHGSYIPVVLAEGGIVDILHAYDYGFCGVLLTDFHGIIADIAVSDEGPIDRDPPYTVYIKEAPNFTLTILELASDIITSEVTVPIGIEGNGQTVSINLGNGLTLFDHEEMFHFVTPLTTSPIYVSGAQYGFAERSIPLSLNPEKIITPGGPAGALTLTDDSDTVSTVDAQEFNYSGVTFTDNHWLILDDSNVPPDAARVLVVCDAEMAGYMLALKNHDGTNLHVFDAPGWAEARWSVASGNWSIVRSSRESWDPRQIASLELMLEAFPSNVTLAGSSVTTWSDSSGNGNDYSEATVRPTYSLTDGPNGMPTIRYPDNGTTFVGAARLVGPTYAFAAADMFLVAKKAVSPGTVNDGNGALFEFNGAAANGTVAPYTDGLHYLSFATTARKDAIASPGSAATWFLQEIISAAGEYTARWNRSQYYTTATNTVAWPASATRFGASVTGSSWWEGDHSGVYLFSEKLSAADRTLMENYCGATWGV